MLETVDLFKKLAPDEYKVRLINAQVRLSQLGFQVYKHDLPPALLPR